jgi:mevalonate kinase
MKHFSANGKLLFTAEYTVLKGALALALPTVFGQTLTVEEGQPNLLNWASKDVEGNVWFSATFNSDFSISSTSDQKAAEQLARMLKYAYATNPAFKPFGKKATTMLEFDREWGLGSSSTLVSLLAQWADIDAMQLFFKTQTGSGYDVVCANAHSPILYQLQNEAKYQSSAINFSPPFKQDIHFVYLGKKQKSAKEVARVKQIGLSNQVVQRISEITNHIVKSTSLKEFELLLQEHEELTGNYIGIEPVQKSTFTDYHGVVKSLGAWGGDFVLVTRFNEQSLYFTKKGFKTILSWEQMFGI